jgi:hypothetical protein
MGAPGCFTSRTPAITTHDHTRGQSLPLGQPCRTTHRDVTFTRCRPWISCVANLHEHIQPPLNRLQGGRSTLNGNPEVTRPSPRSILPPPDLAVVPSKRGREPCLLHPGQPHGLCQRLAPTVVRRGGQDCGGGGVARVWFARVTLGERHGREQRHHLFSCHEYSFFASTCHEYFGLLS